MKSAIPGAPGVSAAGNGISTSPSPSSTVPICIVRTSPKRSLNHPTSQTRIRTPTIPKMGKKYPIVSSVTAYVSFRYSASTPITTFNASIPTT